MAGAFARLASQERRRAQPGPDSGFDAVGHRTAAVRRFVRLCDRHFGARRARSRVRSARPWLDRAVVLEILTLGDVTATEIARDLGVDPGYLSRTLVRLEDRGLIERRRLRADSRKRLLLLTAEGRALAQEVDACERGRVREALGRLPVADQYALVRSLQVVEELLGRARSRKP